jgi:hypothetical protein
MVQFEGRRKTRDGISHQKCVGVLHPGYHGASVMTYKSGYDQFPPATNVWGTKHLILNMVPPLLTEEEGPPT